MDRFICKLCFFSLFSSPLQRVLRRSIVDSIAVRQQPRGSPFGWVRNRFVSQFEIRSADVSSSSSSATPLTLIAPSMVHYTWSDYILILLAGKYEDAPLVTPDPDVIASKQQSSATRSGFGVLMLDFANVFKAFIGTNFLGLPYAYGQGGITVRKREAMNWSIYSFSKGRNCWNSHRCNHYTILLSTSCWSKETFTRAITSFNVRDDRAFLTSPFSWKHHQLRRRWTSSFW